MALGLEISKQFKIPVLHPQPRRSLWADIFFETDQKNKVYDDRAKVSFLWRWPKTQLPCPNSQGPLTCILIDDIVTTGASLLGMQRELTERGYRVQNALTLLRAPLLLPNRKL